MNVYIDNSALRAINYNLTHPAVKTLEKAVSLGKIRVLINSIFEGEFLKHCDLVLNSEKDEIRKIRCLEESLSTELCQVLEKIDKVNSRNILKNYKKKLNCEIIDTDVDWRIVFQKYFKGEAPFSTKKKDEFPDAFVAEMLSSYFEKNLVIISGDNDFFEWAKLQKGVLVFRSIRDYVDYNIRMENDKVTKFYLSKKAEIEQQVKEHFINYFSEAHYFEISSYFSEIELAKVMEIRAISDKIISLNLEESEIEVEFNSRGSVELEISAAVVVYDSIDKEDIHLGSNARSAEIEAEFKGKARIAIDIEAGTFELVEVYDEEVFSEDFDIPHEWESFLDE